jgi:L-asparaginase II
MRALETGVVEEARGGVVEARHRVHAVIVDASGAVLGGMGDPEWTCTLRSAAKPLQALPAVRDGVVEHYGLEARHVAIACGSHEGTPAHAAAVAEVIARAGLSLSDLRPRGIHPPLAPEAARALALAGRTTTVLEHNCSGNHALMLARESMLGRDPAAYLDPGGPAQADATEAVALACGCEPAVGGDRCGMRAYSLPLRNAALGYLRLAGDDMPEPFADAARGVAAAMREAPQMVAGPGSFDSLANALPHVVAKRGALGAFCCASAETGRGGALKIEDGSFEAMEIAALTLLEAVAGPLGEEFDPWRERLICDGNGAPVGVWSRSFPVL